MNEENVFPGRKQARVAHWVMTAFFALFMLLYVAFPIFMPKPFAFVLGGIGLALFGTMGAICIANLIAAYSTVRVDDQGFAIEGPRSSSRVAWTEIQDITTGARDTGLIKLKTSSGIVRLRLGLIEDGQQLGRIVRSHVPPPSPSTTLGPRTYRQENFGLMSFIIGLFVVMLAGGTVLGLLAPTEKGHRSAYMIAVIGLLYIPLLLNRLTSFARLEANSMTLGNLFQRRTILLSDIEAIRPVAASKLRFSLIVRGKAISIPPGLEGTSELRASLIAATGCRVEIEADPAPPAAAVPTIEPQWFKPKKGAIGQFVFIALCGAGLTALGPMAIIQDPRSLVIGIIDIALFGSMTLAGVLGGLASLAKYRVDDCGIQRESVLKPWGITWDRVSGAWNAGQYQTTLRLIVDGKPRDIDLAPLEAPTAFVAAVRAHLSESAPMAPRKFANRGPLALCVIGALFALGSLFLPDRALTAIFVVFGLLLAGLGFALGSTTYETTNDGIWVRNPRKKRLLRFEDIKRLEIDTLAGKGGSIRRMTLEHAEGGVNISSGVPDFAQIESFVRAHLDPDKIHDAT